MGITYDEAKNASNIAKHGISLAQANSIEWDSLWSKPDIRRDYAEERFIGYAYIGLRLFCVVFTDRDGLRRIISLRKANPREVNYYAKT
jgi:uncharacterized DUF497 family protein